ncbi:hypothetical protein [Pseudomonas alkylphenolica]|uniref:hypothetical protein n=1 Tax=Pseudomonas alkylphenolica TaxID=237609 RepID=UPI000B229541|nr:hypothetical protein [Pseudomonas alkylphenolica]
MVLRLIDEGMSTILQVVAGRVYQRNFHIRLWKIRARNYPFAEWPCIALGFSAHLPIRFFAFLESES